MKLFAYITCCIAGRPSEEIREDLRELWKELQDTLHKYEITPRPEWAQVFFHPEHSCEELIEEIPHLETPQILRGGETVYFLSDALKRGVFEETDVVFVLENQLVPNQLIHLKRMVLPFSSTPYTTTLWLGGREKDRPATCMVLPLEANL